MGKAIAFFAIMLGITVGSLYAVPKIFPRMFPHPAVKLEGTGTAVVKATSSGYYKGDGGEVTDLHLQDGREFVVAGRVIAKAGTPLRVQTFSDGSTKLCFATGAKLPLCESVWQAPTRNWGTAFTFLIIMLFIAVGALFMIGKPDESLVLRARMREKHWEYGAPNRGCSRSDLSGAADRD